jgi:hypothetical protein
MYVTEENNFIPYDPSNMNQNRNFGFNPYFRPRPRPFYPAPFFPGYWPPFFWYGPRPIWWGPRPFRPFR